MRFCPKCGHFINEAKSCSKCNYIAGQKPITQGNKIQVKPSVHNKPVVRKRGKPYKKLLSDATMIAVPGKVWIYAGTNAGKYIEEQFFDAKKSAFVCAPWISEEYVARMKRMADNGVDVKIITQDNWKNTDTTDSIRDSMPPDSYRIFPKKGGLIHTKLYIIDGSYAVFGSANFTKAALWGQNHELVTISDSTTEAKTIEDMFFRLWKKKI